MLGPRFLSLVFGIAVALFLGARHALSFEVPSLVSEHAVFQRGKPVKLWGRTMPYGEVRVLIADRNAAAKADRFGRWALVLDPLPVGGPYTLVIEGLQKKVYRDIMVGDVWLCAGQSNMVHPAGGSDLRSEADTTYLPEVRIFRSRLFKTPSADHETAGVWFRVSPENTPSLSAVAFKFAKQVHQTAQIPIGIIDISEGGSPIHSWLKQSAFANETVNDIGFERSFFWKTAIEPLRNTSIRGIVWYQGEQDNTRSEVYSARLSKLIDSWRIHFEDQHLPFIFAQLPNFGFQGNSDDCSWALVREAQAKCASKEDCYMTVNIDTVTGAVAELHPFAKRVLATRLADQALYACYGKPKPSNPHVAAVIKSGNCLELPIAGSAGDVSTVDGSPMTGFFIAGADRVFFEAEAKPSKWGDGILLSSKRVEHPIAARYAWGDNPKCNVFDRARMPLAPFRSEPWTEALSNQIVLSYQRELPKAANSVGRN